MPAQYLCNGKLNLLNSKIKSWRERKEFKTNWNNVAEKLLLVVTEIGECYEAFRSLSPSLIKARAKNPKHRGSITSMESEALTNFEKEIADTYIRLGDFCASLGIDIETAINRKMQVNEKRPIKHGKHR